MYIYVITNSATGKIYIGQHKRDDLKKYFQTKLSDASKHRGGQSHLYASMRKYPREVWSIEPLMEVETKAELDRMERLLIALYDTRNPAIGYNICKGGEGFTGKHSEESRQKMRDNSARPWAGKKRSPESMVRAADTRRRNGYTYDHLQTPKAKVKRVVARRNNGGYKERVGYKHTPETIEKMSSAALNRDPSVYFISHPNQAKTMAEKYKVQIARVKGLYASGLSLAVIAEQSGMSMGFVRKHTRDLRTI